MRFHRRTELPAPRRALADWHFRPGAFERLTPPWERARRLGRAEPLREGLEVEIAVGLAGPLSSTWRARHRDVDVGGFVDEQIRGPFQSWEHRHRFIEVGAGSVLEDEIDWALPLGPLSAPAAPFIRKKLERMFRYRHAITASDVAAHTRAGVEPMRIAITGASGLIGRALVPYLSTGGHEPIVLVRPGGRAPTGIASTTWDPRASSDLSALEGVDAVIHLAGAGISDERWTPARKALIRDSRVDGTRHLSDALARLNKKPRVLVCASGSSFYGDTGDSVVDETSPKGSGFLADVTDAWERAADPAREAGIRVVHLRTGMVVAGGGGALDKMMLPFLAGVGGVVGDGRQWVSFIALDDVLDIVLAALTDERLEGPVNTVAPTPVTNRELTKTLGRVLRRPTLIPVPTLALRAIYGEIADETLLSSSRLAPAKLQAIGHEFRFPDLESAIRHALGR